MDHQSDIAATTHPTTLSDQPPRPYREPLRATLLRTLTIAFVLTTLLTLLLLATGRARDPAVRLWLTTYPAVLWFPLGGHYVELLYLNVLRMRFPASHRHRRISRIGVWFIGGLPLGLGLWWTWTGLGSAPPIAPPWWWGMPFFVVVEFVVHGIRHALGHPNFWDGRE